MLVIDALLMECIIDGVQVTDIFILKIEVYVSLLYRVLFALQLFIADGG